MLFTRADHGMGAHMFENMIRAILSRSAPDLWLVIYFQVSVQTEGLLSS